MPERLDLLDLGEEAVAADVEAPAVALDGAADAADDGVGLEDRRRDAVAGGELVGRGQAGRPGADDDDVRGRAGAVGGLTHGMQCTGGYGRTAEPSPTGGYGTQTPVNASTEYPTSPAADSTRTAWSTSRCFVTIATPRISGNALIA